MRAVNGSILTQKKVVSEQDTRYRTPQMTPSLFGKLLTFLVSSNNSLLVPTTTYSANANLSMIFWSKLRQRICWCTWEMSNLIRPLTRYRRFGKLAFHLSPNSKLSKEEKASSFKGALMDYELTCCITRAEEACIRVRSVQHFTGNKG